MKKLAKGARRKQLISAGEKLVERDAWAGCVGVYGETREEVLESLEINCGDGCLPTSLLAEFIAKEAECYGRIDRPDWRTYVTSRVQRTDDEIAARLNDLCNEIEEKSALDEIAHHARRIVEIIRNGNGHMMDACFDPTWTDREETETKEENVGEAK